MKFFVMFALQALSVALSGLIVIAIGAIAFAFLSGCTPETNFEGLPALKGVEGTAITRGMTEDGQRFAIVHRESETIYGDIGGPKEKDSP